MLSSRNISKILSRLLICTIILMMGFSYFIAMAGRASAYDDDGAGVAQPTQTVTDAQGTTSPATSLIPPSATETDGIDSGRRYFIGCPDKNTINGWSVSGTSYTAQFPSFRVEFISVFSEYINKGDVYIVVTDENNNAVEEQAIQGKGSQDWGFNGNNGDSLSWDGNFTTVPFQVDTTYYVSIASYIYRGSAGIDAFQGYLFSNMCQVKKATNPEDSVGGNYDKNQWSQNNPDDMCGDTGIGLGDILGGGGNVFSKAIAGALCALIQGIGDLTTWMVDALFKYNFNAYFHKARDVIVGLSPGIPHAYAAASSDSLTGGEEGMYLRDALTLNGPDPNSGWIITAWKVVLGLANFALVVVLIFLAIVNVLHIQYDTYAIKKALPILIIGVILANFSLLIMRMMLDFSNILTSIFTGNMSAAQFAGGLIKDGPGSDPSIAAGFTSIGLGGLLLWFLFSLYVFVAFFILGVLFYIRYAVIVICAILAPLAFVAMAFPPTATFFKQWWGWATKYIFMKPIVFFLLWLAYTIRTSQDAMGHLTAWIIIATIIFIAITVPFKLGGVVMDKFGGMAKKAGGFLGNNLVKKPLQNEWEYRKKTLGGRANAWLNKNRLTGGFRARRREELKSVEEELKQSERYGYDKRMSEKQKGKHGLRRRQAQDWGEAADTAEQEIENRINAGERLEGISNRDYKNITGQGSAIDLARKYMDTRTNLNAAKNAVTKRGTLDICFAAQRDLRAHEATDGQMKEDLKAAVQPFLTRKIADFTAAHGGTGPSEVETETLRQEAIQEAIAAGGIEGAAALGVKVYDEAGTDTGNKTLKTYSDIVNEAAQYRAKAKAASSPAEQAKWNKIAEEYEKGLNDYKTSNQGKYDYDAILDRNAYGRRFKELNPAILEEADITFQSSTGKSVVADMRKDVFGTSEFRASKKDAFKALRGDWKDLEDTAAFAVLQQIHASHKFMVTAAQGDVEGITSLNDFYGLVEDAHRDGGASEGDVRQIKVDAVGEAVNSMGEEQINFMLSQIKNVTVDPVLKTSLDTIPRNAEGGIEMSALTEDQKKALSSFNMTKLRVDNTREGQAAKRFLGQMVKGVHENKNYGLSGGVGVPLSVARPNAKPTQQPTPVPTP